MTIVDHLMNEVISYGGLAMRRCDVYREIEERTGDLKAADYFAFRPSATVLDVEPLTLKEAQQFFAAVTA